MINSRFVFGALMLAPLAQPLCAQSTIQILRIGDTGTTADGTIFKAEPNPTTPSTGTGVFEPFVRTQAEGNSENSGYRQSGYNTDVTEPNTNYDTKGGSPWTRSIRLAEVGIVTLPSGDYYQFALDSNEEGNGNSTKNEIDIVDVQIFISGNGTFATPELSGGYTGTPYDSTDNALLGSAPVWTLDSATNGDVTVVLQSSICDSNGQCGSGHGDMEMLIPVALFGGLPSDFLVFYVEYDRASRPNGGFEEWRTSRPPCPTTPAEWNNYCDGDAGCYGVPSLTAGMPPVIGTTFDINVGNAGPMATTCGMFWSLNSTLLPLPMLGGTLCVDPPFLTVDTILVPAGGLTIPCAVAYDCGAVGLEIFLQVLCQDGCAPAGLSFSRGMRLQIGV